MFPKKPTKEENYQYLVKILKTGNVDSAEKAKDHISGLVKKSWRFSIIPTAIIVFGAIFLPQLLFFWFMFSSLGLAWIWCSTFATSQMMKRYIREEFEETPQAE